MVFKIFNKKKKNGRDLEGGSEYTNTFFEADEIYITPPYKGGHIAYFKTFTKGMDDFNTVTGEIDLDYQGYELTNSSGVTLERYITTTNIS